MENKLQEKILSVLNEDGLAIRDIANKIKVSYYSVNLEVSRLEGMGMVTINKIGGTKVVRRK